MYMTINARKPLRSDRMVCVSLNLKILSPPTFNILASARGGQKPTIFKKLEGSASTCKDFSLQQGNIGPCKEFTRKSNAQGNGKEKCKN
jgi:hypothetical protein